MSELVLGAITIRSTDILDNDKLIKFLTPHGVLTAKARGIKKADAKLKFCAQPFCFAEITLAKRGDFYTLTGASLYDTFFDLTQDYDMFCAATAVLETADLLDNAVAGRGMIEIVNAFKSLLFGRVKESLVKYLLIISEVVGYRFETGKCGRCTRPPQARFYFDSSAGVVCNGCLTFESKEISAGCASVFRLVGEADYDRIKNMKLNDSFLNEALLHLSSALEYKTDHKLNAIKALINA